MMIVNKDQDPSQANARTLASILFKNTLFMNVCASGSQLQVSQSVWYQIEEQTRENIKSALLGNLGNVGGSEQVKTDQQS
jgi:hypothetical protein